VAWLLEHGPKKRPFAQAAICAAILFAFPTDERAVQAFCNAFVSGANLSDGSPVLALRNFATTKNVKAEGLRPVFLKTLRAIAAFRDGESVELLRESESVLDTFLSAHGPAQDGAR